MSNDESKKFTELLKDFSLEREIKDEIEFDETKVY